MIKKIIQKNWWLILVGLGCLFAYCIREHSFTIPIVSNPDSTIIFSTTDMCLEQTWQPNVKKIYNISAPYEATKDFCSEVQLTIYSDDCEQELVSVVKEYRFTQGESGTIEFSFKPVGVILGERYHIQLYFKNVENIGELQFASGSSYAGCKIGEQQVNEAVAMQIGAIKTSALSWLVAVLFPLGAIALFFMVLFGRKWEETVGVALITEGLVLYVFGLLGYINWGIYAIFIVALIAFSIAVYEINCKNIRIRELLSPGFWVFWGVFVLIVLGNNNMWYGRFDEYSHWGLAVKDMFYYDVFAKHINTTVLIPRYLPFITLIEYLYVYLNGIYVEHIVYIAFQVTMLSLMIIMCKEIGRKRDLFIPIVGGMMCIPPILFYDISSSIYVDPLLGILATYILICYYSEDSTWFSKIQVLIGLIALALTKDMGVVIGGLLALVLVVDTAINNLREKKNVWERQMFPTICLAGVILSWLSWQMFMSVPVPAPEKVVPNEVTNSQVVVNNAVFQGTVEASGISIDGLVNLFTGQGSDEQKQVIKNMLVKIFDGDMYYIGSTAVSYVDVMLLCILVIALLFLLEVHKKTYNRIMQLIILLSMAGMGYCAVMCIMYLFAFPINEALKLESIERYLGSFLLMEVMVVYYFVSIGGAGEIKDKKKEQIIALMLSVFVLIIAPINNIVIKNQDREISADMVYWYDEVEEIFRSFAKRGERAAYICSNAGTESYFIFRNAVSPQISERMYLNIVSSEEIAHMQKEWYLNNGNESPKTSEVVTVEEWKEYLSECQYLFVLHADDFFVESYSSIFDEPETIRDGSIYYINNVEEVRLTYVGNTGIKKYK